MTAFPIKWHEDGLAATRQILANKSLQLEIVVNEITRLRKQIRFYEEQILEAKKRGKESFDQERFLVRRKSP